MSVQMPDVAVAQTPEAEEDATPCWWIDRHNDGEELPIAAQPKLNRMVDSIDRLSAAPQNFLSLPPGTVFNREKARSTDFLFLWRSRPSPASLM